MSRTASLKCLANNVLERLERNNVLNKGGTKRENLVPGARPGGTKKEGKLEGENSPLSDQQYDYEERLAIAEYDGRQSPVQARRVAGGIRSSHVPPPKGWNSGTKPNF